MVWSDTPNGLDKQQQPMVLNKQQHQWSGTRYALAKQQQSSEIPIGLSLESMNMVWNTVIFCGASILFESSELRVQEHEQENVTIGSSQRLKFQTMFENIQSFVRTLHMQISTEALIRYVWTSQQPLILFRTPSKLYLNLIKGICLFV